MASHDKVRIKKGNEIGVRVVETQQQSQGCTKAAEHRGETERAQNVGKFEMQGEQGEADVAKYRQAAQQNSMDALRAAEERYNKAKQVSSEKSTRDTLAAKDVVAETGKGSTGYVGSVATTVKDKAVVAGWGAGEYSAEKVADATKAVANVSAGAAGYVGDTAVAAKDYGAQKLAAAKDAVVATQESAKDYAARKRAEAEGEMLAKQSAEADQGEVWSGPNEERHDDIAGAGQKIAKEGQQAGAAEAQGGVLQAIGETVLEIGQTTKDLLVGKGQTQDSADLNK